MAIDPMDVPAGVIAIAGGLAGVVYIGRGVYRLIVKTDKITTMLFGDPESGEESLSKQIGAIKIDIGNVAETQDDHGRRLARVEYQLKPNGGGSLYDKVDRTLSAVRGQDDREAERDSHGRDDQS